MVDPVPNGSGTIIREWHLDAVVNATTAIAHRQDGNGDMHVALVDSSGVVELGSIIGAGPYDFGASALDRGDGKRCAVYMSDHGGLFLGCEGAPQEAAGILHTDADHPPLPFVHGDGSISVFTQSFAAFTEIERNPTGTWTEHEQFVSSISYPDSVTSFAGLPVVCFMSPSRHAVVRIGDSDTASAATASYCKIVSDEAGTTHVLTDMGYGIAAANPFTLTPVDALAGKRPDRIVLANGKPFALDFDASMLVATPLPTGAPIMLATSMDSTGVVGWNAATGSAYLVTSKLDTSSGGPSYPQTFTFQTGCLAP